MSNKATRTERKREQTRSEILKATRDIILRDGMASFAVSAVADELGLTKPAVYYYFRSKEALIQEFLLREWLDAAAAVQEAVEQTETGADAVCALIRTVFDRYRGQLELFMFCYRMLPTGDFSAAVGPDGLQRIRPVNDMFYGGAEKRLRADQKAGRFPRKRDPRRFAFTAHTAVIGVLNMMAMVAAFSDPLVHSDEDLINDICQTYRDAALPRKAR